MADEENWNKTHRFASWCFVGAGILTLAEAFFIWYAPVVIFGSIFIALFLPVMYSFLLFKKKAGLVKYVLITLFAMIFLLALVRVLSGEDDWICQDGRWVQHGHPSSSMPERPCQKNIEK